MWVLVIEGKWNLFLEWDVDTSVQIESNEGWLQHESCYIGVTVFTGTSQHSAIFFTEEQSSMIHVEMLFQPLICERQCF